MLTPEDSSYGSQLHPAKIKGGSKAPPPQSRLAALGLAARHLLDLALFRSASGVARFERVFHLPLLARGTLGFLAVFLAESCCIRHKFDFTILKFCTLLCRVQANYKNNKLHNYQWFRLFRAARTSPPASSARTSGIVP